MTTVENPQVGVRAPAQTEFITSKLDAHSPAGPLEGKWEKHKFEMKLVNPANKRKIGRASCRERV